ncbi:hypothetical protein DEH69_07890 [Streptomyces sp. PT12]|nr:hypothetical protein DEH69_07890 [Streptomyces sp. PT12]
MRAARPTDESGQRYIALNGGPHFPFAEAVSLYVDRADRAEESQCGWLKDRYGLSWQIVPRFFADAVGGADRAPTVRRPSG